MRVTRAEREMEQLLQLAGLRDDLRKLTAERDQLRAEVERLRGERDGSQYNLKNLLATIHRDGGHYLAEHGEAKAFCDALDIVVNTSARAEAAETRARSWRDNAVQTNERLSEEMNSRMVAEAHVADLRGALEEVGSRITGFATVAWNAGQNPKGPWMEREREERVALAKCISAALARTPASAGARIKAEALLATATELENLRDLIQEYIGPDDARDDIRRICWSRAKDLRAEADRLKKEAANGPE